MGRHIGDADALALQDGVGGEGGGVHDPGDRAGRQPGVGQRRPDTAEDALRGVAVRTRTLGDGDLAERSGEHDVREGPADVDAEGIAVRDVPIDEWRARTTTQASARPDAKQVLG